MKELSVTVTVGNGSEKHNHDLDYRATLEHVHERDEGVIEVIPYRPYQEQIDAAMKPYIDQYNAKVDQRYKEAWERYNSQKIKSRPKRKDYQKMGYDYYAQHVNDMAHNKATGKDERVPMFRSLIIGIGDKDDRLTGRITEEQAKAILTQVCKDFKKQFPDFLLLGATLHLDEQGFYHAHLDYKPMYEKSAPERGLAVGIGQDAALEHMGFEPEQSIINGRDKAPLIFNAFRNRIYHMMEDAMSAQGLRLQYGVSEKKDPGKDSSRNQRLEVWQQTQDAARSMQHQKNVALEIITQDTVSPEGYKQAMAAVENLQATMAEVETAPQAVMRKEYRVSFKLFDQMKSVLQNLQQTMVHLVHQLNAAKEQVAQLRPFKAQAERAEKAAATWRDRCAETAAERDRLREHASAWQYEGEQMRKFMGAYKYADGRTMLEVYDAYQDAQEAAKSRFRAQDEELGDK